MTHINIQQAKVVSDPMRKKLIDIRPVLPMVEVEEFQRLRYKYQLGVSHLVFPSATHSRLEHSFGAYYETTRISEQWVKIGLISEVQAQALCGYALWHDIGHSAFSHVTEALCPRDNDEQGRIMIDDLKSCVEKCGIDFELFSELFRHENPLYLAVHDKNLGIEKLDYLERDSLHTIGDRPLGIDYLRDHIYFLEGGMVVDECAVGQAKEMQNFYVKMYRDVYLRKPCAIGQRMVQKMTYYLIQDNVISPDDLYRLSDFGLLARFEISENPAVQALFSNFMRRALPREAIVVKMEDFVYAVLHRGKSVYVHGASEGEVGRVVSSPQLQDRNPNLLLDLEKKIAGIADISSGEVLIVPFISPHRFKQQDIGIYDSRDGSVDSLFRREQRHKKEVERAINEHCALRICTIGEENRKKLSSPDVAEKVLDLIFS